MRISNSKYIWVFNEKSKPIGIWVSQSLSQDPNMDNILKMAVSMEKNLIEKAGHNAEQAGFGLNLYMTISKHVYRKVQNIKTVVANNVSLDNGYFLMIGNSKSPRESQNPSREWEVRKNRGRFNLLPCKKKPKRKKKWWEWWED